VFRRTFFKAFGSAILGTAIILNLPETLVPIGRFSPEFKDIFGQYILDCLFMETPFLARLRTNLDLVEEFNPS